MYYCVACKTETDHVNNGEFAFVCESCGLVANDTIYLDPNAYVGYQKSSTYKYMAHWNEHIKAVDCGDPPIPEDIYVYIRLGVYKAWLQKSEPPKNKKDIRKILTSITIPEEISEKYIVNRDFNLHRRYYERWRTILHEMEFVKRRSMDQNLAISLTHLFKSFIHAFSSLKATIGRKSIFKLDFLIYFFLEHLLNTGKISKFQHMCEIHWFPIHKPINQKTLSEFEVIANKCNLVIDFNKFR